MANDRRFTDGPKLMRALNPDVTLVNDEDTTNLRVNFRGPPKSFMFEISLRLERGYPNTRGPILKFLTRIYHPNIDFNQGYTCVDVLNENWNADTELKAVFTLVLPQLLKFPNPARPFNREAAILYSLDKTAYENKVKETCEKYARKM